MQTLDNSPLNTGATSMREIARKSITATLGEIIETERLLTEAGADIRDPDEWLQLRDIVARIERRLLASLPSQAAE
jgi:hypothetical protein